jgi:hypothetical protein
MWIVTTRVRHGPVTVAAERGGLLIRWRMPIAGSNPARSPMCLYPNGRGNASRARPVLVRVEPGTPFPGWRGVPGTFPSPGGWLLRARSSLDRPRRPLSSVGLDRSSHAGVANLARGLLLRAVMHQVRQPPCHGGETGSFPVQRAIFTDGVSTGVQLGLINRAADCCRRPGS